MSSINAVIACAADWPTVKHAVMQIERDEWDMNAASEQETAAYFMDDNAFAVLLMDQSKQVVGYAGVRAGSEIAPNDPTYHVWVIALSRDFRGKGLLQLIMNAIENELLLRNETVFSINADVANGLAEKFQKNYEDRIIEQYEWVHPLYGVKKFIKIKRTL